jgi:RNA polymerase sigma-70 factor (ECF subfamily)
MRIKEGYAGARRRRSRRAKPHIRGAVIVASQALLWSRTDLTTRRASINGAAGIIAFLHGRPFSIATLTVKNGKIAESNFLAHPDRIAHLDLTELGD